MEGIERLAVAQALYKKLGEVVSTKSVDNERYAADEELREMYVESGIDRRRIQINGTEVGTLSARISKPKRGVEPRIVDYGRFLAWLQTSDGGCDTIERLLTAKPDWVLEAAIADGELPDGCAMAEVDEPARWTGTTLRIDPQKVAQAYAGALPTAVAELLLPREVE